MIEIVVTMEDSPPLTHRFEEPRIRIGRDADNDLVLDSPGCSRHHAEIVCEGGVYKIIDLGSTNGILVGRKKVSQLELAHGVVVTIGQHQLAFSLPDDESSHRTVALDYGQLLPEEEADEGEEGEKKAPTPLPVLYLLHESRRQKRSLKIAPGVEYVLGRSPSADMVIEDRQSSKRHAVVSSRGHGYFIRDLGSSNGTLVNNERIQEAPLAAGDEIRIGSTVIRVRDQIADLVDEEQLLERTRLGLPDIPELVAELSGRSEESVVARRRKSLFVALGIGGALLVAAVGFLLVARRARQATEGAGEADSGAEILAQVAPVVAKELVFEVTGTGSVKAGRTVTMSAELPGRVIELPVTQGAVVQEGDLLAKLNDRDIVHQIEEARASIPREQVELAREDYQRKERLFNDGAIVRSLYDQSKNNFLRLDSAFRTAQAKISQLNEQLAKTRLTASFPGVVAKTFVNQGEFVGPGSPLLTLENVDEVSVQVHLADRDFVKIHAGQAVEASTDAYPDRVFHGEIDRLASAANPVTKTFEVEARLQNPALTLRTGMIAELRIIQERERALVVPVDALVEEDGDRATVFVVRDGLAHRVEIRLGRRVDRDAQVLQGLSEGDLVIVSGHQRIRDSQPVKSYQEQ